KWSAACSITRPAFRLNTVVVRRVQNRHPDGTPSENSLEPRDEVQVCSSIKSMVGVTGFEPATPTSRKIRSRGAHSMNAAGIRRVLSTHPEPLRRLSQPSDKFVVEENVVEIQVPRIPIHAPATNKINKLR